MMSNFNFRENYLFVQYIKQKHILADYCMFTKCMLYNIIHVQTLYINLWICAMMMKYTKRKHQNTNV